VLSWKIQARAHVFPISPTNLKNFNPLFSFVWKKLFIKTTTVSLLLTSGRGGKADQPKPHSQQLSSTSITTTTTVLSTAVVVDRYGVTGRSPPGAAHRTRRFQPSTEVLLGVHDQRSGAHRRPSLRRRSSLATRAFPGQVLYAECSYPFNISHES